MSLRSATDLARRNGFVGVIGPDRWRGYDVYTPIDPDEDTEPGADPSDVPIIGLPYVILDKGSETRFSTVDETLAFIGTFDDDNSRI